MRILAGINYFHPPLFFCSLFFQSNSSIYSFLWHLVFLTSCRRSPRIRTLRLHSPKTAYSVVCPSLCLLPLKDVLPSLKLFLKASTSMENSTPPSFGAAIFLYRSLPSSEEKLSRCPFDSLPGVVVEAPDFFDFFASPTRERLLRTSIS